MRKADAILAADIHLRESAPVCRLDNFMEAQERKHVFLRELQSEHRCPILVAGDLYNHWKPNPYLIGWAGDYLSDGVIAVPGQHDLPGHSLSDVRKSGIYALAATGKICLLVSPKEDCDFAGVMVQGFPWGISLAGTDRGFGERRAIALIHYGVYQGVPHYPGAEKTGGTARSILRKMPGFDLILSGDNHLTFTERFGSRLLVNPGSFMRTTADQADHKPCVFLWYAKENEVDQVFLPYKKNVISREHIEVKEDRDERVGAFVQSLNKDIEVGLSYEKNMEAHIAANEVEPEVTKIIWEAIG